jgi:hypothetical protein
MTGTTIDGKLDAESLQVGSDLYMRDAHYGGDVDMVFARVGGNLDLRGASLANLDLSGVSVAGDLRLGGSQKSNVWTGVLNLRNAHAGNLADTTDGAWPTLGRLHLDGFSFNHLGRFSGETGPEMRNRGIEWWDNWARLDPSYSPGPYAQLAAALTNAGFGIGSYTFRVLYWIIGISLLGAIYLRTRVKGVRDGHHRFFWCLGASLARLLPVMEINKEFTAFFDDPKRERLTGWQSFIFSAMGIVGFLLGAILIAAVSGLTQSS